MTDKSYVVPPAGDENFISEMLAICQKEEVDPPAVKWNTKMIRYWEEIYYEEGGQSFTI